MRAPVREVEQVEYLQLRVRAQLEERAYAVVMSCAAPVSLALQRVEALRGTSCSGAKQQGCMFKRKCSNGARYGGGGASRMSHQSRCPMSDAQLRFSGVGVHQQQVEPAKLCESQIAAVPLSE